MSEERIDIPLSGGICDSYLFRPEGREQESWPAVLFLSDAMGIRPAKRKMARRLAAEGYVVLLPNVFYRTARAPVFSFIPQWGEERTMKLYHALTGPVTPEAMERDGSEFVDFLAALPNVAKGGMGVVGYCFGGAYAMRGAARRPDKIAAAASFHGGRLAKETPDSPHRQLPRIKARLYFGHAVEDETMPEADIKKLEAALAAWGGRYESETYAGALHAWTVPGSPVYNEPAAERHFVKLTELFAAELKSQ